MSRHANYFFHVAFHKGKLQAGDGGLSMDLFSSTVIEQ